SSCVCVAGSGVPASFSLFPYTTLFRSIYGYREEAMIGQPLSRLEAPEAAGDTESVLRRLHANEAIERDETVRLCRDGRRIYIQRSEEHTSELQSRENLVCRLLLEKKKK